MNSYGKEEAQTTFEICVVVSRRNVKEEDETCDCVEFLVKKLRNAGFIVERVHGLTYEFIKLAAPLETMGRAVAQLQMKEPTYIGMDLQFEWEDVEAFVRQTDGSLFSWFERFQCYQQLLHGIVNKGNLDLTLALDGEVLVWEVGEPLLKVLESEGIVKQVFPLHDEIKRETPEKLGVELAQLHKPAY